MRSSWMFHTIGIAKQQDSIAANPKLEKLLQLMPEAEELYEHWWSSCENKQATDISKLSPECKDIVNGKLIV